MSAPHAVVTADELLAKMRKGIKEVHEIRMRDLTISVRVLSVDEMNTIRRDAARVSAISSGDETDRYLTAQKYTLKLASALQQNGAPLLSDKILGMLTVDEVNYLYEEYMRVMDSVNPSMETVSSEQFQEVVNALKKNTISSRDLPLLQLRAICTAYVDLIQRQESRTSQAGS